MIVPGYAPFVNPEVQSSRVSPVAEASSGCLHDEMKDMFVAFQDNMHTSLEGINAKVQSLENSLSGLLLMLRG